MVRGEQIHLANDLRVISFDNPRIEWVIRSCDLSDWQKRNDCGFGRVGSKYFLQFRHPQFKILRISVTQIQNIWWLELSL